MAKSKTKLGGVRHIDDDAPIGGREIKDSDIAAAFKAANIDVSTLKKRRLKNRARVGKGFSTVKGFDQIKCAIAEAVAKHTYWEMGLSYDDAVKTLSDMIEAADKLQAHFAKLFGVNDPYNFEDANYQLPVRILLELDRRLAGSDIDARTLVQWVSEPLALLKGRLDDIASCWTAAPKDGGKSWSHLEGLLCAVHDVLTWNGIATVISRTNVDTKTSVVERKTSTVGLIVFSLTKLLPNEMRPKKQNSVETLYRNIRPAIEQHQAGRLNRWRRRRRRRRTVKPVA